MQCSQQVSTTIVYAQQASTQFNINQNFNYNTVWKVGPYIMQGHIYMQTSIAILYRWQAFICFNARSKLPLQSYCYGRPLYNAMLTKISIAILYRWQAFTRFNVTCKLQLQSYWNGRPLYNAVLHVNFNCNLIQMVGLYISLLRLINIHEVVTWLIKIA